MGEQDKNMNKNPYCINCLKLPTCTKYPNKNPRLMYCDFHSYFSKLVGSARKNHEIKIHRESLVEVIK